MHIHTVTIEGTALFGYGNNIVSATFGGVAAQIVFNAPTHLDSNVQVQIQPNNNTADTEVGWAAYTRAYYNII